MKFLNYSFLVISILMMLGGIILDIMIWLKLAASDEPQLVLHLSTFALIFTGFGNIVSAVVNKRLE